MVPYTLPGDVASGEGDVAREDAFESETGAADLRLAAADQAREADDFAGVDRETEILHRALGGGEVGNFQKRRAGPMRDLWERPD